MIYWFIGQPGCGKTTLARHLKLYFEVIRVPTIHLDGDDLRKIFGNLYDKEHFTKEYRIEGTRQLQRFVAHIADQGINVIVSTVNPYKDVRDEFKKSRKDVVEICVSTDDIRGREGFHAKDFESPDTDYISIKTGGGKTSYEIFERLLLFL